MTRPSLPHAVASDWLYTVEQMHGYADACVDAAIAERAELDPPKAEPLPEPVAWMRPRAGKHHIKWADGHVDFASAARSPAERFIAAGWTPLYSAPQAQTALPVPLTDAGHDVLAERKRQVEEEGWTPGHDDQHRDGSMALAAAVYALIGSSDGRHRGDNEQTPSITEILWPWDWSWFKPKSRRCNLIRAAALLLAEIERLDRRHGIAAQGDKPWPEPVCSIPFPGVHGGKLQVWGASQMHAYADTCVADEIAAMRAELELRRKSGSASDRLHNLCDGIADHADGSEWSEDEWQRIDAENKSLRERVKALEDALREVVNVSQLGGFASTIARAALEKT